MRDLRHHLKHVKRKILRDTRRVEQEQEAEKKAEYKQALRNGAEPEMLGALLPHECVVDDEKTSRPIKKSVRRYH